MIAHAQERQFNAIIFHKLDRFSRNIEHTLRYFRDLNSCDVSIASVTEDFDFTTAQGRVGISYDGAIRAMVFGKPFCRSCEE